MTGCCPTSHAYSETDTERNRTAGCLRIRLCGKNDMKKSKVRDTVLKWLLLAGLLTYAIGMTVWASGRADARLCNGVEVEVEGVTPGMENMVREGVLEHLSVLGPIKGRAVGNLNLKAIQQWMDKLSNLEHATCAFLPDGRLRVSVEALVPEMRVFGPGGTSYYVNRDGKRMAARQEFFADVPVVSGRFDGKFRETALLPLLRRISADPMLSSMITMVEVRSPENIYLYPRVQGHLVNLGDTSYVGAKLTALKAFYRKVMPCRGWQTYELVNLKYAGRVVATLRVKPVIQAPVTDSVPDTEEQALQQSELEQNPESAPLTNPQH